MCVVTLLPLVDGFVLTSNRDEHISRPSAIPPLSYEINGRMVTCPKDPQGSGTWIASSSNITLCLLNGAFINHEHRPPYKRSRGLVVLDFFEYNDPRQFADGYDFGGIEPFTMVVIRQQAESFDVHELRWNGEQIYLRDMPANLPNIWSSVTLYSAEVANQRKAWLSDFLQQTPNYTPEALFRFHHTAGVGDPERDFIALLPNRVRTVSISQVVHTSAGQAFNYETVFSGQ